MITQQRPLLQNVLPWNKEEKVSDYFDLIPSFSGIRFSGSWCPIELRLYEDQVIVVYRCVRPRYTTYFEGSLCEGYPSPRWSWVPDFKEVDGE